MQTNDPDQMNEKRVAWAQTALNAFQKATRCDPGDEALRDLLTDLRHWADKEDICWEEALAFAMGNYREEIGEE